MSRGVLAKTAPPLALEVDFQAALGEGEAAFPLEVSFQAPEGVTALIGRSGAGKTSVARALAGLLRPRAGKITVQGRVYFDAEAGVFLPPARRRVGYVFQDGRLFPHLSVRGNLRAAALFGATAPSPAAFKRVVDLLGVGPLLRRRTAGLSGGEKQRVAIGRALLADPDVLVMDEPLAALDAARKTEILPYLERLRDAEGPPILYVTHALEEAARLATTLVALEEGRVVRAGPADAMFADPGLFPLLGRREAGAVLEARVLEGADADGLTSLEVLGATPPARLVVARDDLTPGALVRLRVRAQDVMLAAERPRGLSALNILEARLASIGPADGPIVEAALDLGQARLLARVTSRSLRALELAPGDRVFAVVKAVAVGRKDLF